MNHQVFNEFNNNVSDFEKGYAIGTVLGDGELRHDYIPGKRWNYLIRLRVIDKEFAYYFYSILKKESDKTSINKYKYENKNHRPYYQISLYDKEILLKYKRLLQRFVLDYKQFSIDFLRGVLSGFGDSEATLDIRKYIGNNQYGSLKFSNTNKSTITLCFRILKHLGYNPTIRTCKHKPSYKKLEYLLSLNRINEIKRFIEEIGLQIKRKCLLKTI